MADSIVVMNGGNVEQTGSPLSLYDDPVNLFVAGFIGSPAMNLLRARLSASNGSLLAEAGSMKLELPVRCVPGSVGARAGGEVIVGIRPEHLADAELEGPANDRIVLEAPVTLAEPVGAEVIAHFQLDTPPVLTKDTIELALDVDDLDAEQIQDECASCTARLDPRTKASRGAPLRLVVDPDSLYFFDPETETALR